MNANDFNRFTHNPVNLDISRSTFSLDHKILFSGNCGDLLPIDYIPCVPGDTFQIQTSKVVRLQPLVTPIMDDLVLDTAWYFVPYRLVWSHWINFMGENTDTAWVPSTTYTIPQITVPSGGFDVGTIADYLGVPPKTMAGQTISALPFRCVAKICDDWYRDENLQNPVHLYVDDTTRTGVNTGDQVTDIELGGKPFIAAKLHDVFTSALPGAQKAAGPTVEFALNGLLPVNAYAGHSNLNIGDTSTDFAGMKLLDVTGGTASAPTAGPLGVSSSGWEHTLNSTPSFRNDNITPVNLFANLDNTSIFDINSLRQAFAIQRYYEKQARSGSRYIESIAAFFGVHSPDARLQRSEFVGGSRLPLNVSSVEQTSATQVGLTPQGNLTGISATGDVHGDVMFSATEHGALICMVCLRYQHTYQQGLNRFWLRKTATQFYNPVFANLGEFGIYSKEIYADAAADDIFGYQEAWYDYRNIPNSVKGEMRSVHTTPLDTWHLADWYTSQPYLSDTWIREDKSMLDRCLAVTSAISNQYFADFYVSVKATRPMPLYSIPGLIDHH